MLIRRVRIFAGFLLICLSQLSHHAAVQGRGLKWFGRRQRIPQSAEPEHFPIPPPPAAKTTPPDTCESSALLDLLNKVQSILLYKPPVGAVAAIAALRLLLSGRIFRLYPPSKSAEGVLQTQTRLDLSKKSRKKKRRFGRSFDVDADDQLYETQGGVEPVRRKLCWAALTGIEDPNPTVLEAVEALHVSCPPGGSREAFVAEMSLHLSNLSEIMDTSTQDGNKNDLRGGSSSRQTASGTTMLLQTSAKTAEIRALDALLRLCRDRLLATSSRLSRTKSHWQGRVRIGRWYPNFARKFLQSRLEGDRLRLSYASAAYDAEVGRLGRVQTLLMERPEDMGNDALLMAVKYSPANSTKVSTSPVPDAPSDPAPDVSSNPGRMKMPASIKKYLAKMRLPDVSRFSLRWNADGKARFSIRVYEGHGNLTSDGAMAALKEYSDDEWINEANEWTSNARLLLRDIIHEVLSMEETDGLTPDPYLNLIKTGKWEWPYALSYVDDLTTHRRVGEGKKLGLRDLMVTDWIYRINILGIPSSLSAVWAAGKVHDAVAPHWDTIEETVRSSFDIAWGIFKVRFWIPLTSIVSELLNRSPKLLDSFDLDTEEASLDHMLRDLGVGDGTPETRKQAIEAAASLYEENLRSGVMQNLLRGRIFRLLLVQVQQLKAGLLSAMGSIDTLVESNRLNVQLLAAIPAVLLVSFGSRLFVRMLYSLRSSDVRPLRSVHEDMSDYLDKMEQCLIFAGGGGGDVVTEDGEVVEPAPAAVFSDRDSKMAAAPKTVSTLEPSELGEFVLYMHSYLVLLDYSSPPYPSRSCDSIHKCMQDLLSVQIVDRQLALLRLIKQKHEGLLKWL